MKKIYNREVFKGLKRTENIKPEIISEDDLEHRP